MDMFADMSIAEELADMSIAEVSADAIPTLRWLELPMKLLEAKLLPPKLELVPATASQWADRHPR